MALFAIKDSLYARSCSVSGCFGLGGQKTGQSLDDPLMRLQKYSMSGVRHHEELGIRDALSQNFCMGGGENPVRFSVNDQRWNRDGRQTIIRIEALIGSVMNGCGSPLDGITLHELRQLFHQCRVISNEQLREQETKRILRRRKGKFPIDQLEHLRRKCGARYAGINDYRLFAGL